MHEQRRFESAIEEYGKDIELKADFAQAYTKRCEAWFAIGRSDQAFWDYNEAITYEKQMLLKVATREYPGFKAAIAQAHFGRAVIHEAQGYSLKANTEPARAKELGYDPALIEAAIGRPLP